MCVCVCGVFMIQGYKTQLIAGGTLFLLEFEGVVQVCLANRNDIAVWASPESLEHMAVLLRLKSL